MSVLVCLCLRSKRLGTKRHQALLLAIVRLALCRPSNSNCRATSVRARTSPPKTEIALSMRERAVAVSPRAISSLEERTSSNARRSRDSRDPRDAPSGPPSQPVATSAASTIGTHARAIDAVYLPPSITVWAA